MGPNERTLVKVFAISYQYRTDNGFVALVNSDRTLRGLSVTPANYTLVPSEARTKTSTYIARYPQS